MKDELLTAADWDTLFTKDPARFIEALVTNILYAAEGDKEVILNRQRLVFEKWLALYNQAYRDVIAKSVSTSYAQRQALAVRQAEQRGRIAALSSLPLKKSLLKQTVDLEGVVSLLRELKQEVKPIV